MLSDNSAKKQSDIRRYLLATIFPIIFLALSLSAFLYDQSRVYTLTGAEIAGVKMIKLLYGSLTDLQKIRGYSQISLWEEHDEVKQHLEKLETQFLERFHRRDWLWGIKKFHLTPESNHLETEARILFLAASEQAHERQLFSQYSTLITEILQLMQLTADHSNLILDPELDTYYLIDVLDKQIPYLAEAIGRVRGMGSGLLAKKEISNEEIERLRNFQAAIQTRIESIENAQDVIIKTSSSFKDTLNLLPENFASVVSPLVNDYFFLKEKNNYSEMSPESFFQQATKAIDILSTPYQSGILILTSKLETRQTRRLLQGGLFFFSATIAIVLLLYFNRAFYLYDQQLHEEMELLSVTDQLTGLYNRRHFYTVFPKELRSTLRNGKQLYLGLLDADNFKRYNDTYGHPAGDRVLENLASTMKAVLRRAGDYCFRVGGEEFCFLFSETNTDNAKKIADRIRSAIEEIAIEHQGNRPYWVVTVSIGLVKIPENPDCVLEQVMPMVDEALYKAKEEGRNQCIFLG